VQYGREVLAIEPQLPEASLTDRFRVRYRDAAKQSTDSVFARKVIVAPGMVKQLPPTLQVLGFEDRVAHASDLVQVERVISQSPEPNVNIAIVGSADDEAFEVLDHCMALEKRVTVTLFADGDSVQQSDKNPYAGNAVLASNTSAYETLSQKFGHGRNRSSMQSDNLASLYTRDYGQGIRRRRKSDPHFDVVQFTKLVGAEKEPSSGRVSLRFQNVVDHTVTSHGPFDFVFAASGYTRGLHEGLLSPLKEYFDDREGGISVNADYRVNLDRRFVDRQAGIWMIDGFEGGANDAFPFMALRAERILRSIMSVDKAVAKGKEDGQKEAVPRAAL
jgi:lysine/ornithine N-monooxygenase